MRVIYGFKGKNDTRQSGMFFTKHIGDLVVLISRILGWPFTIRTVEPTNTGKSQVFALNSDEVASVMATVNTYHFNVFQLLDAGQGKGMRFLLGELLSTYGLIGSAIIQGRLF